MQRLNFMPRPILVIDDDESICLLVKKVLDRAGYETQTATSHDEALALFIQGSPQLVIVDKNLPGCNGLDLIAELRRLDSDLTAILMTAFPEPILAPVTKIQGYLAKPFASLKAISNMADNVLEFRKRLMEARARQRALGKQGHSTIGSESLADSSKRNIPV